MQSSAKTCASSLNSCFPDVLPALFHPWSCQSALLLFLLHMYPSTKLSSPSRPADACAARYMPGTLCLQVPMNAVPCPQNATRALALTATCIWLSWWCSVEPTFLCFPHCSAPFLSVKLLTLHPIDVTSDPHLLENGNHSKYFVVCAK